MFYPLKARKCMNVFLFFKYMQSQTFTDGSYFEKKEEIRESVLFHLAHKKKCL